MKKTFFSIFVISLLTVILFSCNFQFNGSSLLTKPDVEAKTNHITISIPLQSTDTSYINIYRKKSTDSDDDIVNLGILYPSSFDSTASAYIFEDYLVVEDTTYLYRARYLEEDGYYTTNWSNEVTAEGGYSSTDSLTYDADSASFTYDEDDYSLTISGTITAPSSISDFSTNYTPMLIVKTEEETQTFNLTSIAASTVISLKTILPSDFLDTEITIVGLTAGKKEYVDASATTLVTKYLYWIEPTEISISGYSDNTFTIPSSESTDGYDYSRRARTN
ncbi:MAG: hypothetical protein K6C97_00720 [Treponema sp.]|nr:hypothetical protein [Treponema sp.]